MRIEYVFPQSFNPDDVDIRLQYISVSQLEKMIETGKLRMPETEELQRMSNAWNDKERSSFIESIMANLPVQLVYLDGSRTPWTVIDGLQRISSIHRFVQNKLVLNGLEYFSKECEGKSFSSIPFYLRSRIKSTNIVAYVINPGTPNAVKFNIFKRINKIGKQRNREELRNIFFQDSVSKRIAKLAESSEFLQATHKMISQKGMADRELVCRYFAFRLLLPFFGTTENMDDFLDKGMDALSSLFEDDLERETARFKTTMQRCYTVLKDIAFINLNAAKKRVNKNLFDAFSYTISKLNDNEYQSLLQQVRQFKEKYMQLFEGKGFLCERELRKTSKEAIQKRFDMMSEFVKQFI
ncbi:DUF262 domain-containing protein [Bacteroides sp. An51A]|uniref:DUF262 domain-containing protein n=1 Tax=Bacteroides sp. An51A TaxID=1965640 RepID=UPI000B567E6A|nr:DUF262 domain-containing protein [Bacteroides sp. An51A]OUN77912.1 hypothetical protein B5G04_17050 [Bacteroides sp. An51A]